MHQEDVGRFKVAVKDVEIVRGIHTVRYLAKQANGSFDGQSSFAAEKFVKRFALDVLHHKIENAVAGFAKIGDADRVRMLDRRSRLCLALKTGNRLAFLQIVAAENVLTNCFYSNFAGRKFVVLGQIDLPHCSAAETADEKVSPSQQLVAGQRKPRRRLIVWTGGDIISKAKFAFRAFLHGQLSVDNGQ